MTTRIGSLRGPPAVRDAPLAAEKARPGVVLADGLEGLEVGRVDGHATQWADDRPHRDARGDEPLGRRRPTADGGRALRMSSSVWPLRSGSSSVTTTGTASRLATEVIQAIRCTMS